MKVYYEEKTNAARILVMGVGGAGTNAVNHMVRKGMTGACIAAANTDLQHLEASLADVKIPLGEEITKGLGAGANPDVGKAAAEESVDEIKQALEGYDMVFITAGMGGGTGTGASPIIARIAKEANLLTVGVVTKPFALEGKTDKAEAGLRELRENTDALLAISNDKLAEKAKDQTMSQALAVANDILYYAVRAIVDIIQRPGHINIDFADVRTVMSNGGMSLMGFGEAKGETRALEATRRALMSPLLDGVESIAGADSVLLNIHSPEADGELTMGELMGIIDLVKQEAGKGGSNVEVIFGTVLDRELEDRVQVTVIATGISERRGFRSRAYRGYKPRSSSRSIERKAEERPDLYSGFEFQRPSIMPEEEDDWQEFGSRA